jgi:hypothetical protein
MLAYPDKNKPFIIYVDASQIAMGAVLVQDGPKDEKYLSSITGERPIYFLSHKLSSSQ